MFHKKNISDFTYGMETKKLVRPFSRVVPHFPDSFRNAAKNVVIRYTYIGGIFSTYGFGLIISFYFTFNLFESTN